MDIKIFATIFVIINQAVTSFSAMAEGNSSNIMASNNNDTFNITVFGNADPSLTELPEWVNRLSRMKHFEISGTGLSDIDITGNFKFQDHGGISNNSSLKTITKLNFKFANDISIRQNPELTSIISCDFSLASTVVISNNPKLQNIDCIQNFNSAESVRLVSNDLDDSIWSQWGSTMRNLTFLDIHANVRVTILSENLLDSPLKNLNISGTGISKIPAFIANMVGLENVDMSQTCITKAEFSAFYGAFKKTSSNTGGINEIKPAPGGYSMGPHCIP